MGILEEDKFVLFNQNIKYNIKLTFANYSSVQNMPTHNKS